MLESCLLKTYSAPHIAVFSQSGSTSASSSHFSVCFPHYAQSWRSWLNASSACFEYAARRINRRKGSIMSEDSCLHGCRCRECSTSIFMFLFIDVREAIQDVNDH